MKAVDVQIPLFEAPGERRRAETRERIVRQVDYCRFPRVCAQKPRTGFTRDMSDSGLCLRTDVAEPVGALLRVVVRGLRGRPAREAIARVAWTAPAEGDEHLLGLRLLEVKPNEPLRIHLVTHTSKVA
jgi:hypothetical protein